jgi:hypothetical protein
VLLQAALPTSFFARLRDASSNREFTSTEENLEN